MACPVLTSAVPLPGNPALLLDVLERRETQLRFSALMTAVAGARFLPGSKVFRAGIISPALIEASDHVKVAFPIARHALAW